MTIETFYFHDHPYEAVVERKAIRRLIARVRDGRLYLSIPYLMTKREMDQAIKRLPEKFLQKLENPPLRGADYLYLLGKRYELIKVGEPRTAMSIVYRDDNDLAKRVRSLAQEHFINRVRFWEEKMGIEPPYQVRIRAMKSRYGTNSRQTHTLTFALVLIHYPPEVIDAIVVHELAHHRHFDHSRAFYEEIDRYVPHYRATMKILKEGFIK